VKSWIRIHIKVKIQERERLKMEPWMLTMEAWRLTREHWRVCRPVVTDLHHFDEEQAPDCILQLKIGSGSAFRRKAGSGSSLK
jgi:hypothetical protein